ncbi:UPF0426 protein At1g28150, chloroplastic [Ziziphus jujuba]|uniref:UPF0426 protein At1g28150, chloroplastic n=1 Tax=Ziziphus jujuba TaxID=326968 RepID=A0A6P4B591_ZIZJJ|nr:UPF0426 protein At1g28150, chloroplastic [Ziziphus jujuba]
MSVFVFSCSSCSLLKPKNLISSPLTSRNQLRNSSPSRVPLWNNHNNNNNSYSVKAFFFNPTEDPVVQEALKEPVAFMGGMFAGLLRLDLNDDPLKEWVSRTVEASGMTEEEIEAQGFKTEEEAPEQIEIE